MRFLQQVGRWRKWERKMRITFSSIFLLYDCWIDSLRRIDVILLGLCVTILIYKHHLIQSLRRRSLSCKMTEGRQHDCLPAVHKLFCNLLEANITHQGSKCRFDRKSLTARPMPWFPTKQPWRNPYHPMSMIINIVPVAPFLIKSFVSRCFV